MTSWSAERPRDPLRRYLSAWVGFSAGPMTAAIAADLALGRAPRLDLRGISVLAD